MIEPSPAAGGPPTACEIERRFRSPAVIVTRSVILGSIGALRAARSFGWHAEGLHHFQDLEPPLILAANHQSHADTAAILGTLPARCASGPRSRRLWTCSAGRTTAGCHR